jgi:hypothetical protein
MSAFSAGTIRGSLDLDTTSFNRGFKEAHTHAETEGGHIREVLESLTEVLNEALGPALGKFASSLQSVFAGFSEGPIIGVMGAIATAAGAVREAVEGVGGQFHQMGLEASKAGVSAEFLSRLAAVGGTVGVSLEQLGTGFKILEQRAEEAGEGNKAAAEGFSRLGISVEQAGELAKNPQALFEAVQKSIGNMSGAAERNTAALAVMGRQGANLVPLFQMGSDEFDKTADAMQRLGGTVDDSEVQMGEAMGKLEGYFKAAFFGIEKAVAKPILAFLEAHFNEIEPKIESIVGSLVTAISEAWKVIGFSFDQGALVMDAILPVFETIAQVVHDVFIVALAAAEAVIMRVKAALTELGSGPWKPEIEALEVVFRKIGESIQWVIDKVRHLIDELHALATTPNLFGTDVNAPRPADATSATPAPSTTETPQPAAATPAAEPAAADPYTPPEPRGGHAQHPAHEHHTTGGRVNPGQQHHAGHQAAVSPPSPSTVPHGATQPAAQLAEPDAGAAEAHERNQHFRSRLDAIEGRMGEATADDKGLFHGRGSTLTGQSTASTLDAQQHQNLLDATIDRQRQPDSITAYRKDHPASEPAVAAAPKPAAPVVPPVVPPVAPLTVAETHSHNQQFKSQLDAIEGRMGEATADRNGQFAGRGSTLAGQSTASTLDAQQHQNLLDATIDRQRHPDTIAAYRRDHPSAFEPAVATATPRPAAPIQPRGTTPVPPAPVATAVRTTPIVPPAAAAQPAAQPRVSQPTAAAPQQGDQQVSRVMTEFAATMRDLIAPMVATMKSFEAVTVSSTALRTTFDALHTNVNSLVSRLSDSGRQQQQQQPRAAGNVSNTFNVAVQFDPRDAVNQFAAKVLPALREIKRGQDQQLAGAMAESLMQASIGGDQ